MLKDWKLKLRYGKLATPYKHYTVLAPVRIREYIEDFDARPGTAWIGVKLWVEDTDEAYYLVTSIGDQTGFEITGNFEVYTTEPLQPPQDRPYAYDINFNYYNE